MAVIIPNSTDTTGGEEFASLDQAEPDSLDFEILGNTSTNGVLSGCEVTTNNSATDVAVSAGEVVIGGRSYTVAADSVLSLPVAPVSSTRFDVVVARVATATTASLAVIQGAASTTNPVFPQSMNVFGGAFVSSTNIDFDTDVVLASLLRVSSETVTTPKIADKRAMVKSTVKWQGATLPVSADDGSFFFKTNESTTGVGNIASGLYIRANGTWVSIAQNNEYFSVPIGSTIWHNSATPPPGYLKEDGTAVSRTTYSELFAVIGTTFGAGDGSLTFNLPNTISRVPRGGNVSGGVGGSDNATITVGQLPAHDHGLSSHTHTMKAHTHGLNGHQHNGDGHSHTTPNHAHNIVSGSMTVSTDNHGHNVTVATDNHSHLDNFDTSNTDNHSHNVSGTANSTGGTDYLYAQTVGLATGLGNTATLPSIINDIVNHTHSLSGVANLAGNHKHTVTGSVSSDGHAHNANTSTDNHGHNVSGVTTTSGASNSGNTTPGLGGGANGATSGPNDNTTAGPSNNLTTSTGGDGVFSVLQAYATKIPYIRAL